MIPDPISEYEPKKLFILCFLWAIWLSWCDRFYNEQPPEHRNLEYIKGQIIKKAHSEFIKRVCESKAVTQWIELQRHRHSNKEEGTQRVPEKLFLLKHANMVRNNPDSIILDSEDSLNHNMNKWIANEFLLAVEDNSFHRPRLRINHAVWAISPPPPHMGPLADPASGWAAPQPGCVV